MRHRVYGKKLGLNKNERTALFKSLVQELVLHGTITTTESKVKAIKSLVDKIINLAKNKNTQRLLQVYFSNKLLQERLIKEIVPKLDNRVSGYTTTMRMGVREGDRTSVVKMSIIGNENLKPLPTPSLRAPAKQSTESKVKKIATPPTATQLQAGRNDKKITTRLTRKRVTKK